MRRRMRRSTATATATDIYRQAGSGGGALTNRGQEKIDGRQSRAGCLGGMSETETHAASYEQECQRAELLGLQPPDKEEFERRRQARLEHAMAEQEAAEAALLEQQDETLGSVGGKLGELNSILSSTQQKLNRFKQTACGSLTNIFSRATATASAADTCPDAVAPSPAAACTEQRRPLEARPPPTAAEVAAAKADKQRRMDSQLDKLDALINQADNAQIAMSEQTQQMRRLAK